MASVNYCPLCEMPVPARVLVCPHCKKTIDTFATLAQIQESEAFERARWRVRSIILLVILITVAILWIGLRR